MCGFAGYTHNTQLDHQKVIKEMSDRIIHRGPDDGQYYTDGGISLGFRRLSIIDLEGGRQPILNEDGTKVLIFNGEIYNYKTLREELIENGHIFTTRTDSEVLLHGYEQWGKELLQKLRGMFAFVIWDKTEKKLFGARDIFGIKPFYYYIKDGEFLFGSEIKSFLSHPKFVKELDEDMIPLYLSYEYIPNEKTIFKNVFKLNGAHCFEYQNGKITTEKYYDIRFDIDEEKDLLHWEKRIGEVFTDSVKMHQISDVEVGCFLSSGVDSSYVVNEVAKGTKAVKTFSVGYEEEKYSEVPLAQEFSKHIGVENISNKISADDFFSVAGKVQYFLDEPMPNPSEIPLYFLAENAAKYVKVVLSGEGADELFGGYPMYLAGGHFHRYSKKVPKGVRKLLSMTVSKLPHFSGKNFIMRGALEPYQRFMRANYVFSSGERQKYLKKKITTELPEEYSKIYFDEIKSQNLDETSQLQYADMKTWMMYDILLKADRMSMAHSLELRVPFLDKEMLELALQIPTKFRAHNEVVKIALRSAALKELPEKTANKKKLGFPVPLNDWLREEKYFSAVKSAFESETAQKFFVTSELVKLLDEHKSGKNGNMQKIWSFYSFILWYNIFFLEDKAKVNL